MTLRLIDGVAATGAVARVFSDEGVLQAMLDFERALAAAGARAGVVPPRAAAAIAAAARADAFDADAIARGAGASATPAIGLVRALADRVRAADADAAAYVHLAATSQDVTDTALVLLLKRVKPIVAEDHARLQRRLGELSEQHRLSVMPGRTLLQPAVPITFGLKAAAWRAALARAWRHLDSAWEEALVVQFGGAAGTRAAAGEHAGAIAAALAEELELGAAPPWHADRTRLGQFMSAAGVYVAAAGKIARDVTLLMQAEVGEAAEPGGGSSTMPHKRNPARCAAALAAATRMPGLVSAFLSGMIQEHERGVGGLQAEWPIVAGGVQALGAAAAALADAAEGLSVDPEAMRANLAAGRGESLAEQAVVLLTGALGREEARRAVSEALAIARDTGRDLAAVLRDDPRVAAAPADVLHALGRPELYLGQAEALRREYLGGDV